MAPLLRVFLVGLAPDDLEQLTTRVTAHPAVTIVGRALVDEIAGQPARVPIAIDAVWMSPEALARRTMPARGVTIAPTPQPPVETLTARELDVLALLADGRANRDIAARLGISEHTVKFHLASIFGKLDVSTRTEAVRRGLEWGLIHI